MSEDVLRKELVDARWHFQFLLNDSIVLYGADDELADGAFCRFCAEEQQDFEIENHLKDCPTHKLRERIKRINDILFPVQAEDDIPF